jgi:hypothetical protein
VAVPTLVPFLSFKSAEAKVFICGGEGAEQAITKLNPATASAPVASLIPSPLDESWIFCLSLTAMTAIVSFLELFPRPIRSANVSGPVAIPPHEFVIANLPKNR